MRRSIALLIPLFFGCSDSSTLNPGADAANDSDVVMDGGQNDAADADMDASDAPDYEDEVVVPPTPPVCTDDPDPGSATFTITTIEIPRTTDLGGIGGFNIDGRISSQVSIAGCGYIDEEHGIDNAFAYTTGKLNNFAKAIDPNIDIYDEVAAMIERGELAISLELEHWNGEQNDSAVTMTVRVEVAGQMQESAGCGRLVAGTLEGNFGLSLPLSINIDGNRIGLELRSPRIRLVISQDGQSIDTTSSYIGGYILWDDGTAADVPGEMKVELLNLLQEVATGLDPFLIETAVNSVGYDVDIDGYPSLTPCTLNENGDLSADSFSVGFRLGGTRDVATP